MKYADLHVHTFYSDSTFSPEEVVSCAKDKGLAAIAICDHDSVDGIGPCKDIGGLLGVEVIPGIELTIEKSDAEIHILGYFIDWQAPWLKERLKEIQGARIERMRKMVAKLKNSNVDVEASDVFKLARQGSVGRLHLARVILKSGKIKSFKEAFDKYIGFLKPCYVPNTRLSVQEAMEIILKAGGVPVLAHPASIGNDDQIPELVECGLKGIEVYRTDHNASAVRRYEEIAGRYNLLITGGSDCHGLGKGRVLLGEVKVPYELVERLRQEADRIKKA